MRTHLDTIARLLVPLTLSLLAACGQGAGESADRPEPAAAGIEDARASTPPTLEELDEARKKGLVG